MLTSLKYHNKCAQDLPAWGRHRWFDSERKTFSTSGVIYSRSAIYEMFLQENSGAARHKDTISPSRPPSIAAVAATSSRYGKWKRALKLEYDMDLPFSCFQKGRCDIRHRCYRTLHMPFKVFMVKKFGGFEEAKKHIYHSCGAQCVQPTQEAPRLRHGLSALPQQRRIGQLRRGGGGGRGDHAALGTARVRREPRQRGITGVASLFGPHDDHRHQICHVD